MVVLPSPAAAGEGLRVGVLPPFPADAGVLRSGAGDLREATIQDAWAATAGRVVPVRAGVPLRVRYPGWRNRGAGPDFRDAVLDEGNATLRGDVEVHRDARDWERHGHGGDARYANVVLHVVGDTPEEGAPGPARVVLFASLTGGDPPREASPFACRAGEGAIDPAEVARRLVSMGLARHRAASARIGARRAGSITPRGVPGVPDATRAGEADLDQISFEEIASALGYAGNEGPMRRCARALPLAAIRAMPATSGPSDPDDGAVDPAVRALLDVAGLGAPDGGTIQRRSSPATGNRLAGGAIRWALAGARPGNHPRRRLAQLVAIARSWPQGGMVAAVQAIMNETGGSPRRAGPRLRALVATGARLVGAARGGPAPSTSRAGDIVVNVLLPLARAVARRAGDDVGVARADAALVAHPPLATNAVIARVAERLGYAPRDVARTAAAQQGLIAIWDGPCRPLQCAGCPLAVKVPHDG